MKNFLIWLGTSLQEDSGKLSIKRIAFALLIATVIYVTIHYTRNAPIDFDWTKPVFLFGTFFGFAAILVGLTYIPTRNNNSDAK